MNFNVATKDNWTPLHIVSYLSNIEIIKFIIDQGVDTSKKIKKLLDKPCKCNYRDLIMLNQGLTKAEKQELQLYKRVTYKQRPKK